MINGGHRSTKIVTQLELLRSWAFFDKFGTLILSQAALLHYGGEEGLPVGAALIPLRFHIEVIRCV